MEYFSHAATIIPVNDMTLALIFYEEKLGFKKSFVWEDPPTYAVLKSPEISIHLALDENYLPEDRPQMYIFTLSIYKLYHAYQKLDVKMYVKLNEADYGMLEFIVEDPSGNLIVFGQENG